MNERDHPLDELLHAYLDGEVTEAERARVEDALATDPSLAQRRDEVAALRAALAGDLPPPEASVVDAQIARAVAAAVVDLGAARERRRRPLVLAAAAAIAGVFLVGSLVVLGQEDDGDETAARTPDEVDAAEATVAADALAESAEAVELDAGGAGAAALPREASELAAELRAGEPGAGAELLAGLDAGCVAALEELGGGATASAAALQGDDGDRLVVVAGDQVLLVDPSLSGPGCVLATS